MTGSSREEMFPIAGEPPPLVYRLSLSMRGNKGAPRNVL
jgi:hypothetical protein